MPIEKKVVSEIGPVTVSLEEKLGSDTMIFGSVICEGQEMDCWISKESNPIEGHPGNRQYTIEVISKGGLLWQIHRMDSRTVEVAGQLLANLLNSFKRTENPIEVKDPYVTKIADLLGINRSVSGTADFQGNMREVDISQEEAESGHPENILYKVFVKYDPEKHLDPLLFKFYKDGEPAAKISDPEKYHRELDEILAKLKLVEDPKVAMIREKVVRELRRKD